MNTYINVWSRCLDFKGRSDRAQFWLFHLFMGLFAFAGLTVDLGIDESGETLLVTALVVIPHYLPSFAVSVRRLHDIDRSGWWMLIGLIPVAGVIVLLVFACTPSTPGTNRFGPSVAEAPHNRPQAAADGLQAQTSAAQLDQLEKLAALRSSGALDAAEFERMKADLLSRGRT